MTDPRLDDALSGLIQQGTLTSDQAAHVRAAVEPLLAQERAEPERTGERVVEILAYVGVALVVAAIGVLASLTWDALGRAGQVTACLVATAVLLGAGAALGAATARRRVLRSILAAVAAGTTGLAAGVVASALRDDALPQVDPLGGGIGVLLLALPMYALWRGGPLVAACYVGGLILVMYTLDQVEFDDPAQAAVIALGLYGLAVWAAGWWLPERSTALTLAFGTLFAASIVAASQTQWAPLGLLLGAVTVAASFTLFTSTRFAGYAVVGAVTALTVPPTAVGTITDSARAVVVVLAAVGLALIAGAVWTARRHV